MPVDHREALRSIRTFPSLVRYLKDELDWPITSDDFEDITFDYTPDELGIDAENAAKIQEIKRLRPLTADQPWGIFFVKFEPRRLPVVALRRILGRVAVKKRASANSSERAAWQSDDLLFISNYGEGEDRTITFAHFSQNSEKSDLPVLKVLGWDGLDTNLHLGHVVEILRDRLTWPADESAHDVWRANWRSAFSLQHREVITTSKALAVRLAALARGIRSKISAVLAIESATGPVTSLMTGFREALIHDLDEDAFADMYAQTIAYGLLSARVADPSKRSADGLAAAMPVTTPFLRELLETFLNAGGRHDTTEESSVDFDELGVGDVVELLNASNMEAVVRDFGDRNPLEDPVIHFYELFLEQYDAAQRMQRGVFYTPKPVVSYIVESVHEGLISEFGLADGLADCATWGDVLRSSRIGSLPAGITSEARFVTILDPATGTGTFLVEVISVIHRTLVRKWEAEGLGDEAILARWNRYVPEHLLPRLYGFELLMAPYAIAHLKIGLKLHETGYRFDSDKGARVYLANALEPSRDFVGQMKFAVPALAHEALAVNDAKRQQAFTVVLGNPPYAGISANMDEASQRLVDPYKFVDGEPLNERKLWLQDDYVKFIRLAQLSVERSGAGVVGLITNHGYLDNPTFRGMRHSLRETFGRIDVLNLHGNSLKKERAPDGTKDENVFEIRQGVGVFLGVNCRSTGSLRHCDLWGSGVDKVKWLSVNTSATTEWSAIDAEKPFFFFYPAHRALDGYDQWPSLSSLMPVYSSGIITARDHVVLDYAAEPILDRIALLRDEASTDDDLRATLFARKGSSKYPAGDSRGWKLPAARAQLRDDDSWRDRVVDCMYRPFDKRSLYLVEWMVDWSRPEICRHLAISDNLFLIFPRNTGVGKPWTHVFVSRSPILGRFFPDSACITYMAPMLTISDGMFGGEDSVAVNGLGGVWDNGSRDLARSRLGFIYAVLNSRGYRERYAGRLTVDFPRVPDSFVTDVGRSLAGLGETLIDTHLLERDDIQSHCAFVGPEDSEVGRVEWRDEKVFLDRGGDAGAGVGAFVGVPRKVWEFEIGGYRVCEKWLKDRRGRHLSRADCAHYCRVIAAIGESLRVMTQIDEAIEAHGGWPLALDLKPE